MQIVTPMKTSRLLTIILTIILCAFATDSAFAKGKGKSKAAPTPEKGTGHVIVSVSDRAISVKNGHDTKNYRIDGHTEFTLDGTKVAAGAVKAGMNAEITPGSIDPGLALFVVATNPTKH